MRQGDPLEIVGAAAGDINVLSDPRFRCAPTNPAPPATTIFRIQLSSPLLALGRCVEGAFCRVARLGTPILKERRRVFLSDPGEVSGESIRVGRALLQSPIPIRFPIRS